MSRAEESADEEVVSKLDRAWNEVYLRNDRSEFARILADDFLGIAPNGSTATKADLMRPTLEGAKVFFSELGLQMYPPTAIMRGRIRVEHADRMVDHRYVRIYLKRDSG